VSGVLYEDVTIEGVAYPLQLLAEYCPPSQKPYPCPPGNTAVDFHDIRFVRVRGYGKTSDAGSFDCSGVVPRSGIELEDVHITGPSGGNAAFRCNNCGGTAVNTTPAACFSK
jgi:hypothetical protein